MRCRMSVPLTLLAAVAAAPAAADEDGWGGVYVVARGGGGIDSDLRFKANDPAATRLQTRTDFKAGLAAELGWGVDFGPVRVETTFSRATANLDVAKAEAGGFTASGKLREYALDASVYGVLPVRWRVRPFLGAGLGAGQVKARVARVEPTAGTGTGTGTAAATDPAPQFDDTDYAFRWHADIGATMAIARATSIELSGRYEQTAGLKFKDAGGGDAEPYRARRAGASILLGIRQGF